MKAIMPLEPTITISEAARIAGVNVQTLILWFEREGLRVLAQYTELIYILALSCSVIVAALFLLIIQDLEGE